MLKSKCRNRHGAQVRASSFVHSFVILISTFVISTLVRAEPPRTSLWIDLVEGEPVDYRTMLDDLAGVRVVYLGERHTVVRHHAAQAEIVAGLASRKRPLVLGLEQIEAEQQPIVERFNRGELDFEKLADALQWGRRWRGYEQYRPVLEAARRHNVPVLGLNARSETIRQVARGGGVAKLAPELRRQLPAEIQLDDAPYRRLLELQMAVHMAATPERLRPMIEAQIARDEAMADTLARYLQSEQGRGRTAVVICGGGHVAYGLATVSRVRRRMPGVKDRIVLFSESGDVVLSAEERAAARPIQITHEQLREVGRPIADYLLATEPKPGQ
jgi:uncharacterized iron-regulated protein